MTEQEIDDLFAATLLGDYDDDQPWDAVKSLRSNGNRLIFEKASKWSTSTELIKRARCADILCQLRAPTTDEQADAKKSADLIFVEESYNIIRAMTQNETDEKALESELIALGHLRQDGSVETLLHYADRSSENIRFSVAWSLGSFSNDPIAIEVLIKLSDDSDDDVRDYALFALGTQSNMDTPELREALARHLDDPFSDAKEEAIAGLAKRKDERAVLPLLRLMESGSYPRHLEWDFEILVGEERTGDEGWGTEDFIDALYARFPDLLPPR